MSLSWVVSHQVKSPGDSDCLSQTVVHSKHRNKVSKFKNIAHWCRNIWYWISKNLIAMQWFSNPLNNANFSQKSQAGLSKRLSPEKACWNHFLRTSNSENRQKCYGTSIIPMMQSQYIHMQKRINTLLKCTIHRATDVWFKKENQAGTMFRFESYRHRLARIRQYYTEPYEIKFQYLQITNPWKAVAFGR